MRAYFRFAVPAAFLALATAASGQNLRSTHFDGTPDAFVRYDHQGQYDLLSTITVEAWVYRENASRCETIASHGFVDSWWLGFCPKLRFYRHGREFVDADVDIPAGQWVHVAASYNGGVIRFYVNGRQVDSGNVGNGSRTTTDVMIGADPGADGPGFPFLGYIDQVRIFATARNEIAIQNTLFSDSTSINGQLASWNMQRHEDNVGNLGEAGSGVQFSPFGILPRDLVVPRAALPVSLDGNVDPAGEYAGAEQMVLRYFDPNQSHAIDATAYLVRDDDNLYIGLRDVRLPVDGRGRNLLSFFFDPNFSQAPVADDTHLRLDMSASGGDPQWFIGDGAGDYLFDDGPPTSQWDLVRASCVDDVQPPCVELRIARDILGTFEEVDAFALGHLGISELGYSAIAPGDAVEHSPQTWARMAYGEGSADLPEAIITGQVRDGVSGFLSSPVEGRELFLSTSSSGVLYTRTTASDGTFRFEVPVPIDSDLRVNLDQCSGCLHTQDPEIAANNIQPQSVAPHFVVFPGCSDGTCRYANTQFFFRSPIGPVELADAAQPRTLVVKDSSLGDGLQTNPSGDDEVLTAGEISSGPNGIADTQAVSDDIQIMPVGEGVREGSPEVILRDSPLERIPPDKITISGQNLHNELDVFLSPANSTGPPQDWEQYPVTITGRTLNERLLAVEVPQLPPEFGFGTRWKWLVFDRWQRPERVTFTDIGPFTYGPSYPDAHGFGFDNKARNSHLDEFLGVYGNNAYICIGAFGFCATRVPDPLYWTLWFGVYELWIGSSGGSCVGMSATSLLMAREELQPETFDSQTHFPAGFTDQNGPISYHYSGILGPVTGPPEPTSIWAAIRINHGVQTSSEFIKEAVRDMDLTLGGDPLARLGEIRTNPRGHVLCMRPQLVGTGHCVTPYAVRTLDPTISRIFVYDNNHNKDEDRFVDINAFSNAFTFPRDDEVWDGQHIFTAPIHLWRQSRSAPGLSDVDDLLLLLVFGDADGLYSTAEGDRWGWEADGTPVQNMPGVIPLVPLGPSTRGTRNVPLAVPADEPVPRIQVNDRGGDFLFHSGLRGRLFQMEVRGSTGGDTAAILPFIEQDNIYKGFRYTAGTESASCTPRIGMVYGERERAVYEWSGLTIPPKMAAEFGVVENARGATYTNDTGQTTTHMLSLITVDGESEQASTKMFGPFDCPAGSTHTTVIENWGSDLLFLRSELDVDGDGTADESTAVRGFTCDGLPESIPQDADGDGVPDGCESFQAGDLTGDGVVGLGDYGGFAQCFSGPGRVPNPPAPLSRDLCLRTFDADRDSDVDLLDKAYFAGRLASE